MKGFVVREYEDERYLILWLISPYPKSLIILPQDALKEQMVVVKDKQDNKLYNYPCSPRAAEVEYLSRVKQFARKEFKRLVVGKDRVPKKDE